MTGWRVPLADLDYDDQEDQAVLDVLHSRWLTMGEVTHVFEDLFAHHIGSNCAIATSNGTTALHLACLACGLGPGDEVIVPSLSFVATANAPQYTGADIRFADIISPHELTISPTEIEKTITPRTKAIIVMHYAGYPCHLYEILEIADRHNLFVIEDAAHAAGARLDGRSLGNWGDIGCFSFFSNKNLATGEGGMLTTNNKEFADRLHTLRSHGMTSLTWDRHQGHAYSYDVTSLGYNYRIDEIRSALGLTQLKKLDQNNALRREITESYKETFQHTDLTIPFADLGSKPGGDPSYHIFPILLPEGIDRSNFMKSLHHRGVQTSIHYPPIHKFSYYMSNHHASPLPVTEHVASREVSLPLYPKMSPDQISLVVDAVGEALS